jgi:hypothetical protein
VKENQFRAAPRAFEAIGGDGEIGQDCRLVLVVDIGPIGQAGGPVRRHQQVLPLHRSEILAVDPDQVHRSVLVLAGGLFGQHLGHRIGGVIELDMDDLDAEPVLEGFSSPIDIGVDVFRAAPGVEIDRLVPRLLKHRVPIARIRIGSLGRWRQGKCGAERAGNDGQVFQHGSSPRRQKSLHTPQGHDGVNKACATGRHNLVIRTCRDCRSPSQRKGLNLSVLPRC